MLNIFTVLLVIIVVAINIFFYEPSYRAKKFMNQHLGFHYRLDIYPEFFGGDAHASELIKAGKYDEFNAYMRSIDSPENQLLDASIGYPYTYAEMQRDPTLKNGDEVEPVSKDDPYQVPKLKAK